jgi:predicted acyl esterase
MSITWRCASSLCFVVSAAVHARAQDSAFTHRAVMVPMRDGVMLNTRIFVPTHTAGAPLPFLFVRTPYGIDGATPAGLARSQKELMADGYIVVLQDIRGRYRSGGQFVMQRPLRANRGDPKAIDESTDAYDTIEWLLTNVELRFRIRRDDGNVEGERAVHVRHL